ncbi:hypothetical protein [Mycoplasma todarodis]|uniref:Uncharacterized protein n=1 Tax=Mycoplasma todarodis TaxID=1937191 RepID=A0A4R0XLL0_9MOLU|nr:hypothetical protein [Mycoplasma todarodis]TCG11576.1 hypothetical protein C4B25_01180 [Mycoplasma todarodis]
MSQKIKKHLEDHKEYSIYETTEGKKGIARKEEGIKPGDVIDAKEMPADHPIRDLDNRIGLAIEELAWIFSKI